MKVLIIEDNTLLAERMKKSLRRWYIPEIALSGDAALRLLAANEYTIILLDLGLPDTTGRTLCKHIRAHYPDIPLLIVTGETHTKSVTELLNYGADDYLTKPFDPFELRARMNALLRRRSRGPVSPTITIDDLVITPEVREVQRAGQTVRLRRKEFDILVYMALNQGRVLHRQNILDHAWPSTSSAWSGLVDVHIKQLRDKIDKPFAYPLIHTVHGVGYRIGQRQETAPANTNLEEGTQ